MKIGKYIIAHRNRLSINEGGETAAFYIVVNEGLVWFYSRLWIRGHSVSLVWPRKSYPRILYTHKPVLPRTKRRVAA